VNSASVGIRGALPRLRGRGEPGEWVTPARPLSALYIVPEENSDRLLALRLASPGSRLDRCAIEQSSGRALGDGCLPVHHGLASEAALQGADRFGLASEAALH
jgi:hypothetical protein